MRVLPLLTAALVSAALYLLVFERDSVLAFANAGNPPRQAAATSPATTPEAADASPQTVSVVALHSVARTIDTGLRLRGQTEAIRHVDVRAETGALVISEPRRKGTYVHAGDLLCRLDPGTREAALSEARARLEEAQINQRAASRLRDKGYGSETAAASADAALRAAQAGVDRAEVEISRLEIRAPFAGHLESDTAEIGSLLQPGGLCATVIQLDPILLVGYVPEADITRVRLGASASARLATGQKVDGHVTFLARAADPTTRTFRVDIEASNPDFSIRDGQSADILIDTAGQPAHLLPSSALMLNDAGDLGVRLVVDGDRVRFAPVKLQRDTSEWAYVTGLPEVADVIVVGQEYVT